MITGTSQADCVLLMVAAGEKEFQTGYSPTGQTCEHAILCRNLGVHQMIVCVNKMDVSGVEWLEDIFNQRKQVLFDFLQTVGYDAESIPFIPISGFNGDNVLSKSVNTPWYQGPTLVDALNSLKEPQRPSDGPLRVPLKAAYQVAGFGTVAVGRVESGILKVGMPVVFSGIQSTIKRIEVKGSNVDEALPGEDAAFSIKVPFRVLRKGMVCGDPQRPPSNTKGKNIIAQILVLDQANEIGLPHSSVLDCHTAHVMCTVHSIVCFLDSSGRKIDVPNSKGGTLKPGDLALVQIQALRPLCVEVHTDVPSLGRFVMRHERKTIFVGMVKAIVDEGDVIDVTDILQSDEEEGEDGLETLKRYESEALDEMVRSLSMEEPPTFHKKFTVEAIQDLDREACIETQKDEIEALQVIYQDNDEFELVVMKPLPIFKVNLKGDYEIKSTQLSIGFTLGPFYPKVAPSFWLERGAFTRDREAELCNHIQEEAQNHIGSPMIYSLILAAEEFCRKDPVTNEGDADGVALRTDNVASTLIGPPSLIMQAFQNDDFVIESIENIVRSDLYENFQTYRSRLEKDRIPNKVDIAFHGTTDNVVGSIVRNGLIVPDDKNVGVRCGSTYGKGIYVSPDAMVSCSYTDSQKLIMCAILMGDSKVLNGRSPTSHVTRGYQSHISPCRKEWVLFNAAQVLPCYILYTRGTNTSNDCNQNQRIKVSTKALLDNTRHGKMKRWQMDALSKEEWVKSRANKHLPFGFGPGKRMLVLDVASSDDDDDDYAYGAHDTSTTTCNSGFQNYQQQRFADRNIAVCKDKEDI